MFIVLKKTTIKRNLAISLLMILIGISLINPFQAKANAPQDLLVPQKFIFYLYPMPQNNGMFWLEQSPQSGYASLKEWSSVLPKGEMIVAVPDNMQLASMGGLDRIGKYVQGKFKKAGANGKYDKDIFKYRRTVTAEGVTDEIEIEIGKHFRDNDNIEKLISGVKKHLTTGASDTQEIKDPVFPPIQVPTPAPDTEQSQAAKTQALGTVTLLGGLWMLGKCLLPLLAL